MGPRQAILTRSWFAYAIEIGVTATSARVKMGMTLAGLKGGRVRTPLIEMSQRTWTTSGADGARRPARAAVTA
jgi:hypothetical protein